VLEVGAMRIAGKGISNFNKMECSIDYDNFEDEDIDKDDDKDDADIEVGEFFTSNEVG